MRKGTMFARRLIGLWAGAGLVAAGLVLAPSVEAIAAPLPTPAPIEQPSASTVSAAGLPTVQIDKGVVWSQAVVGNTVYAGGSFANVRPPGAAAGTQLTARGNLLAFNITTGALVTSFAPKLNGQVKVVRASPDGSRIYVGGSFTTADGQSRFNLAAYSTATGKLVTTFKASAGGSYVNAIAVTSTTVYIGGLISAGNGVARKNFAAFDTAGKLLGWAPTSDLQVDAMVLTPKKDKLIVGGRFSTINSASHRGLVALSLTNGSVLTWAAPNTIKNGSNTAPYAGKAGIFSLSADATTVYGTGWVYANAATGNLEGTFSADPATGAIKWIEDCHGDTYGSFSDGTNVYVVGHPHDCQPVGSYPQANPAPGNLRHALAFTTAVKGTLGHSPSAGATYKDWFGTPAPAAINWFPDFVTGSFTGQGQAAWTIEGNGNYVVAGGEFPYVNGILQQGLVRFARRAVSTANTAPRLSGTKWAPTAVSTSRGTARVTIPENWDRDDLNLTYEFARFGKPSTVVYTTTAASTFWDLGAVSFNDTGLTPGATYTYQVTAVDAAGNRAKSNTVAVTVNSDGLARYPQAVLDDGSSLYWRLGGSPEAAGLDWAGNHNGSVGTGVTTASTGALANDSSPASMFNGTTTGLVGTASTSAAPSAFSLELLFKTTSTAGGRLIGYGSSPTGSSSGYDRHVYMRNDGRLVFGVNPGTVRTVTSTAAYNDGMWHHVVATEGASGITLYVDGLPVASDSTVTGAQQYTGYWRVGGDNLAGWPNRPTSNYFSGSIDEAAVYPKALNATQVRTHFQIAKGTAPHAAPTAAFTVTPTGLTTAFDSSGSSATDGATISSYAWTFGDGTTSTTASPSHVFAADGTYNVTLKVTDSKGAVGTKTTAVTVAAPPHPAPTAAFTVVRQGLTATFDSSGSSATDGATISSYAWTFGDTTTSAAAKPAHTYQAGGTYNVTLKVTDSKGGVNTRTTPVTVSAVANDVVAADDFARTSATGWGTADVGGAWTAATGTSVSGGAGRATLTAAGQTRNVYLVDVTGGDVDSTVNVAIDKLADGGGAHLNYLIRSTAAGDYRVKLRFAATSVTASIAKFVGTTETPLISKPLPGVTYAAGQRLTVRFQAISTGSATSLKANVWRTGSAEPSTWLLSSSDTQAALQGPGRVGFSFYLTGSSTSAPLTYTLDDLRAVKP